MKPCCQFGKFLLSDHSALRRAILAKLCHRFAQDSRSLVCPNRVQSDKSVSPIVSSGVDEVLQQPTVIHFGIECEEVLRSLRGIGADIGQGYVIAHPLTSAQLDEYLARPGEARRLLPDLAPLLAGG